MIIEGLKYLLALVIPLGAFYLGDMLYGSSHLIFHHPCEQEYMGCLKLDFLSFALKGFLAGFSVGLVLSNKKQIAIFICASILLISLVTLRAAGFEMDYLLDPYLIAGLPAPFIVFSVIGYFFGDVINRVARSF